MLSEGILPSIKVFLIYDQSKLSATPLYITPLKESLVLRTAGFSPIKQIDFTLFILNTCSVKSSDYNRAGELRDCV